MLIPCHKESDRILTYFMKQVDFPYILSYTQISNLNISTQRRVPHESIYKDIGISVLLTFGIRIDS